MYMHIYIYVVQIVLRKLSLTVFVTHTFIIIRCLLFGKKVFIPSFFLNFSSKTLRVFSLLLYLLRAFNDDDDTRGRTPTALLKNVENNFKVI